MIPMEYFNLDKGKFHELVIHSANLMADDRTASIIRINKILYYADFASYRETTRPITGACYRKYNEGPAPDYMFYCVQHLNATGRATTQIRKHILGNIKHLITNPNFPPDLSAFNPDELEYIDQAAEYLRGKSPNEIIQIATQEPSWIHTSMFNQIIYDHDWAPIPIQDQAADLEAIEFAKRYPVIQRTW